MGLACRLAQQEPSGSQPRSGDQTGTRPLSGLYPLLCFLSLVDHCRLSCPLNFRPDLPSFTVLQDYLESHNMAPSMQPPPLSIIKSWPAPNYVNPETRGNANVILNIVLYSLLLFFIGLRIFTRTYLRSSFGADDVFILLALVCCPRVLYMKLYLTELAFG